MDAFIAQAKALVRTVDEAGRKQMLDALRDVSYSLESAQDSANRIMYMVQSYLYAFISCLLLTSWQHMQVAVVRIGCDLKLFNILAENPNPLTVDSLSQKTSAAPTLLGRYPY